MQAYRLETVIQQGGTLTLSNLPSPAGATIEVIILVKQRARPRPNRYPLRGMPITYLHPTEPVAQVDWEAVQVQP